MGTFRRLTVQGGTVDDFASQRRKQEKTFAARRSKKVPSTAVDEFTLVGHVVSCITTRERRSSEVAEAVAACAGARITTPAGGAKHSAAVMRPHSSAVVITRAITMRRSELRINWVGSEV